MHNRQAVKLWLSSCGLMALACLAAACTQEAPLPPRPNVIILLIDTLRSDRIGAYGAKNMLSPNTDRMAREGFCFEHAIAPCSWTKPSVASLFTGLYPARHGAIGNLTSYTGLCRLEPEHITLGERLKTAGYRTAAVVRNPHITPRYGFDQGFDEFILPDRDGKAVLAQALEWIDDHQTEEPFFLYIHIMDPHLPYTPPDSFREKYIEGQPGEGAFFARDGSPVGIQYWCDQFGSWQPSHPGERFQLEYGSLLGELINDYSESDKAKFQSNLFLDFTGFDDPKLRDRAKYLTSLYNGEVAYTDHSLGVFFEALKKRGLYDRSVMVFTGDHGEGFLEHDKWGHGGDVHAEEINVPLIFHIPMDGKPVQGSSQDTVSLVDIMPTVLDLMGLDLPENVDGISLWPSIREPGKVSLPKRMIFSEVILEWMDQVAAVAEGKKLIRISHTDKKLQWCAYDLEKDPCEKNPIPLEEGGEIMRKLKDAVEKRLSSRRLDFNDRGEISPLSEEELKEMKALGYF